MMENERTAHRETLEMAKRAGNQKHIRALEKMGDYPPENPEQLLKLLPKMRKIQEAYDDGPASGTGFRQLLQMARRSPSFQWGDFVSFLRMMQVNRPLYPQMLAFNLYHESLCYQVPVHYILGAADTITPTSLGTAYYNTIEAPHKTLAIIPGAGHNPMYERADECAAALRAVRESLE